MAKEQTLQEMRGAAYKAYDDHLLAKHGITKAKEGEEFNAIVEAMAEEANLDIIAEAFTYPAPHSGFEELYFFRDKNGKYFSVVGRDYIEDASLEEMIEFLESNNQPEQVS